MSKSFFDYLADNHITDYYHYDFDTGHNIMAIPKCLLDEAIVSGDPYLYQVPMPLAYVMEKGFSRYREFLVCDAYYDSEYGLCVPEEYDTF